jgi:hypothetical protein
MPAFLQEPPKAKAAKAKRKPSKRAPRKKKQSADKA